MTQAMRLRQIGDDNYEGVYRGHSVGITRISRGNWMATIDTAVQHFESLDRARRECRQAIDWRADRAPEGKS